MAASRRPSVLMVNLPMPPSEWQAESTWRDNYLFFCLWCWCPVLHPSALLLIYRHFLVRKKPRRISDQYWENQFRYGPTTTERHRL